MQADEVLHENNLPIISKAMHDYSEDENIEALALKEMAFYYDYKTLLNVYPSSYTRRCWIVKPHKFVLSRGDAAGFCVHPKYKERGRRIRIADTGACLFHYHNVKKIEAIREKNINAAKNWSEISIPNKGKAHITQDSIYSQVPKSFIKKYKGSHPKVMNNRIKGHNISIDHTTNAWREKMTLKEKIKLLKTKLIYKGLLPVKQRSYKLIHSKEYNYNY